MPSTARSARPTLFTFSLLFGLVAAGCGEDNEARTVDVDTSAFEVDQETRIELESAQQSGHFAQGTYSYDDDTGALELFISDSTFVCGLETGTYTATVTLVDASGMVWELAGSTMTWTRVDAGDGITGVFRTEDPTLFVVLDPNGVVSVFGDNPCTENRDRNGEHCIELFPADGPFTLDGNLDDWDNVASEASIFDAPNDQLLDDPGADLSAMKVGLVGDTLFVLMRLPHGPSEAFLGSQGQGSNSYMLDVSDDRGLGTQGEAYYDPTTQMWTTSGEYPEVSVAVGTEGLEWQVDLGVISGASQLARIRVFSRTCAPPYENCVPLDEIDECGFVNL